MSDKLRTHPIQLAQCLEQILGRLPSESIRSMVSEAIDQLYELDKAELELQRKSQTTLTGDKGDLPPQGDADKQRRERLVYVFHKWAIGDISDACLRDEIDIALRSERGRSDEERAFLCELREQIENEDYIGTCGCISRPPKGQTREEYCGCLKRHNAMLAKFDRIFPLPAERNVS